MDPRSNYDWLFMPSFEESFPSLGLPDSARRVNLPFTPTLPTPNYIDKRKEPSFLSYEKTFEWEGKENEELYLRMEGAFFLTGVYLNGTFLETKNTSFFPTTFRLTPLVKAGENRLLLKVDARERKDMPPFGGVVDYRLFGGIYRSLSLETKNKIHFEDLFAYGGKDGNLLVEAKTQGEGTPCYSLFDGEKCLASWHGREVHIDGIVPWSPEHPKLYRLEASMEDVIGKTVDKKVLSVGFRDAIWKEDGFYLNGEKRKLFGLNRHMNYPYLGASAPKSLQEEDVRILKEEAGINVVRTSHYPQSEDFLSACDRLGLLVIDEVPGWQFVSKEEVWRKTFLSYIERMVLKERNHPSLIAYGVRVDESKDDHDLYAKANDIAHRLDPFRQTLGVRNFKNSELLEDIYAYNDFSGGSTKHGLDAPKGLKTAKKKPILISEYCGHMFPSKTFDSPKRRKEHVERHLKVLDDLYRYNRYAGGIGWCAFDYMTNKEFGSGDGLCYHGVFDSYRLPKDAAFAYLSNLQEEPVIHVVNNAIPGDEDESLMQPLLILTNCDFVKLYLGEGTYVGTFYPDRKTYPHLPHPPIVIDDWIGESFHEPNLSKRAKKRVIALLNEIARKGVAHLKTKDYLRYVPLFLLDGLDVSAITSLYYKYVTSWGKESKSYRIVGYKEDKEALVKRFGVTEGVCMRLSLSNDVLRNEETYDASLLRVSFEDPFGNALPYYQGMVALELQEPLQSLGPKSVPAIGGHACFYIGGNDVAEEKEVTLVVTSNGLKEEKKIRLLPSYQRL